MNMYNGKKTVLRKFVMVIVDPRYFVSSTLAYLCSKIIGMIK